jgi:hypothetical protein
MPCPGWCRKRWAQARFLSRAPRRRTCSKRLPVSCPRIPPSPVTRVSWGSSPLLPRRLRRWLICWRRRLIPMLGGLGAPIGIAIEVQTVRWMAAMIGYPADCGGLLGSCGTMGNFIGLLVARRTKSRWDVRIAGLIGAGARGRPQGSHSHFTPPPLLPRHLQFAGDRGAVPPAFAF